MASRRSRSRSASAAKRGAGPGGRERLLAAATECFAANGYAATGIAEVCKTAGVAKTALYWHFEHKEGLLAAVIEQVGTRWIEHIQKAVYLEGDPLLRVQRLADEWRRIIEDEPELLRMLLIAQLERGETEPARSALRKVWQRAEQALIQGIEDALGTPVRDVDLLAGTVFTLLQGVMLRKISDPDPENVERSLEELKRTVVLLIAERLPDGFPEAGQGSPTDGA